MLEWLNEMAPDWPSKKTSSVSPDLLIEKIVCYIFKKTKSQIYKKNDIGPFLACFFSLACKSRGPAVQTVRVPREQPRGIPCTRNISLKYP